MVWNRSFAEQAKYAKIQTASSIEKENGSFYFLF
jgi:hypothetical protein